MVLAPLRCFCCFCCSSPRFMSVPHTNFPRKFETRTTLPNGQRPPVSRQSPVVFLSLKTAAGEHQTERCPINTTDIRPRHGGTWAPAFTSKQSGCAAGAEYAATYVQSWTSVIVN
ncbi:uncharacterized protein BDZ83DRAFT_657214 [Colletotrichum acutatum]|uniref:Uncharacterized protein n=1 Tax=Glomerella acutata TaxID=27357 RepID=A0AAD8X8S8_GLOAC|nr:uncharacterized protein BDZ83DRAFT_657214 [Colletotrichum acutatum]KAK1709748.1 hypothetical protein BDZ83DRAFT_657214 [Colletotrichum acutatum]